tara:strand:- start:47 stop:313 length:267 start_codon:yes stop_codon:yes gene_type:complete
LELRKMVKVRCRSCGKEIEGHSHQTRCCGCSNMTTVTGDSISARDMSKVMIVSHGHSANRKDSFTSQDLEWQEQRRKRKVKKLNFEVR